MVLEEVVVMREIAAEMLESVELGVFFLGMVVVFFLRYILPYIY